MTILKSGYDRYNGELKTNYPSTNGWGNFGFSGNPFGDDECGQFYSRALSIWSVLLAAQGFHYDGIKKELSFNPKWQPRDHVSFFSTSKAWGLFSQKINKNDQQNTLQIKYGTLSLKRLTISSNGKNLGKGNTIVHLNGEKIRVDAHQKANQYTLDFPSVLTLKKDDIFLVNFK